MLQTKTSSSAHDSESIATWEICKYFKTELNNFCRQFILPCCVQSNCGLFYFEPNNRRAEGTASQPFKALADIPLPSFVRMTHEQRKIIAEHHTEKCETSKEDKREKVIVPTAADTSKNLNVKIWTNSSFEPMGYKSRFLIENYERELESNLKMSQKRKLENLKPLNSTCNDAEEKRFKPNETQNIPQYNDRISQASYGAKPTTLYQPSFLHNMYGFQAEDVSRKRSLNMKNYSGSFGLLSVENSNAIFREEGESSDAHVNFSPMGNISQVAEVGSTRFRTLSASSSPLNTSKEMSESSKRQGTHVDETSGKNIGKFISLDSTKSSFLTMMRNLRARSDHEVIPCPFCSEEFSKYPDLKTHVQNHKTSCIPGTCNGMRTDQPSSGKVQTMDLVSGNSASTPLSKSVKRDHPLPSRRSSISDGNTRSTSVIHFAEKQDKTSEERTQRI